MALLIDTGGFQTGLALGAASLASIGPTTLMIIREGFGDGRKLLVASAVWSVQIGLICASFFCADLVSDTDARTKSAVLWLGLLFLSWFALRAWRASSRPGLLAPPGARCTRTGTPVWPVCWLWSARIP